MRGDYADGQNSHQLVRKRAFGWRPKGQRIFVRSFSKRPTATSLVTPSSLPREKTGLPLETISRIFVLSSRLPPCGNPGVGPSMTTTGSIVTSRD
jgi:hypothetical protein